jgi:UDP-N-acetylmuramyl pentapeptide phosphotransferase/UDP-N-acetylglucosamine-1-phosphate transferase
MLYNTKFLKKNYKGQYIPLGMGMFFPIALISSLTVLYLFFPLDNISFVFILGVTLMSFLGIIDDLLGNRDTTGLKGHISKLFQLQLTTGGLKALMGGIVSLLVSIPFNSNILLLIFNALIIASFTNLINLLDLRPGRAIKFYLLYTIILFGFYNQQYIYLLLVVTIIALVYFPMDIKAIAMMGDAGSNSLGFVLGFFTTIYFTNPFKVLILILLIFIHIYAERSSITKLIENNRILSFIDKLGR